MQKRLQYILFFLAGILFGTGVYCSAAEYQVGSGDVLLISVYDHQDLETKVRVDDDGNIIMPLLGAIKVGKLSIPEITNKITGLLADGYIVNPQVNIFVEQYRSKKVVVLGQVNKPGLIELDRATTFLELLSKAEGLTEDAGDSATIKRRTQMGSRVITVDLNSLVEKGDMRQNIEIFDGDTINVAKAGMCFVTGEVNKPGTYKCSGNTTVLKIIALAGGFNGKASKSGVRINRDINGQKQLMKSVPLDTRLREGDVIVVPESFF